MPGCQKLLRLLFGAIAAGLVHATLTAHKRHWADCATFSNRAVLQFKARAAQSADVLTQFGSSSGNHIVKIEVYPDPLILSCDLDQPTEAEFIST